MKMDRHHKNPLLREFCPSIWSQFRSKDICLMPANEHAKYHSALRRKPKFVYLRAVADEIASEWVLGEESLANELDDLWEKNKNFL